MSGKDLVSIVTAPLLVLALIGMGLLILLTVLCDAITHDAFGGSYWFGDRRRIPPE